MKFSELWDKAQEVYQGLSARERIIVLSSAVVIVLLLAYSVLEPISQHLDRKERELQALKTDFREVDLLVATYKKRKAKRDAVRQRYLEVEITNVRSHLETLLQNKARVEQGRYSIKPGATSQLGNEFERVGFSVKFDTTSLSDLVNLLQEITRGSKPLVLSRLDIEKSRRSDKLTVAIDVSSIRKAS